MSAGIGLGLDGPGVTPEGDYTLSVFTDGDAGLANSTDITVDWGDGTQSIGVGAGDYEHSLAAHFANYEGDVPLTDYTITTTAVARAQAAAGTDVVDAAVDSLGRRVTVGGSAGWEVRRYNADGTLNLSVAPILGGSASAVAVDTSNRIIVAGRSALNQFAVARLTTAGALDTTFGVGGIATTTFGPESAARAIAIEPGGKLVVGGNSGTVANAGFGDFVVARYNTNGSLDTTFSGDGKASQAVAGPSPLHDIALSPTGRVVTVGTSNGVGDSAGVVVAFTAAGASDGLYTINAQAGNEQGHAVTVLGDGSILVAEQGAVAGRGGIVLVKLTAAGAADTSFGGGDGAAAFGYAPFGDGVKFDAAVRSVLVRDDLSIVVGGQLANSTLTGPHGNDAGLAVFKFNADGSQDLTFDSDGVLYTAAGPSFGGVVSGGHVRAFQDTLIQSGTVSDGNGGTDGMGVYVEIANFAVSVTNTAPLANFAPTDTVGDPENFVPPSNVPTAVPGDLTFFALEATDPSLVDASSLTYTIDWGDGTTESFTSSETYDYPSGAFFDFPMYVAHAFEASGALTVKLTVSDDDGGTSAVATLNVSVATSSAAVDDYAHPGQTVLYVAAPKNVANNNIKIRSSTTATQVIVDGASTFAGLVDRVVVYGNVGDDMIQVEGTAAATVEIYGGAGNDKLKSGNRNDVVVGGDGDDMVTGGVGRDFLDGGFGADKIVGDSEDDILIGGVYVGSNNREAIAAVMAEWTSGNTYNQRVQNLREGTGLNGGNVLSVAEDDATIFDDNAADKLTGDAGQDWFFANAEGPIKDKITDLLGNEFTDEDRAFVLAP